MFSKKSEIFKYDLHELQEHLIAVSSENCEYY